MGIATPVVLPLHPITKGGQCGCGGASGCPGPGKHPAIPYAELTWDNRLTHSAKPAPGAGYAIKTGALPAGSDVFVVDIDGPEGEAAWAALGGFSEKTYSVSTPRPGGGRHLYFRHPGFYVKQAIGTLGPKIDIKGDGNIVVGPGSPHKSGGVYTVLDDAPPADAPAWLLDWLRAQGDAAGSRAAQGPVAVVTDPAERAYRRVLLAKRCAAARPPAAGGRHDAQWPLVQYGAYDLALGFDDVLEAIATEYNPRCKPPMDAGELAGSVRDHFKGAARSTRPRCEPLPADLAHLAGGLPGPTVAEAIDGFLDVARLADGPKSRRSQPAERALRIGGQETARLRTGFPVVDAATRGGILGKKFVVIGGAPGAGKTALLVKLGFSWLEQGIPVGILAADEDADALLIRFGQLVGIPREDLESGAADARRRLADWCGRVPLLLADGDEDNATIEDVSVELRALAAGRQSALLVDSIQTARNRSELPKGADLRSRVNENVRVLKRSAKVDGHVVAASSEISKAAYRNKAQAENINALSAFKESGDIEYGVSLALVLTSCQGSPDLVDAAIVKNRLGRGRPEFLLRLDHDRADVTETTKEHETAIDPYWDKKNHIVSLVDEHGLISPNAIYHKIGGNKATSLKIIRELLEANVLHEDTGGVRFPLPGEPGYKS